VRETRAIVGIEFADLLCHREKRRALATSVLLLSKSRNCSISAGERDSFQRFALKNGKRMTQSRRGWWEERD
jgi:hypothetical protein